MRTEAMMTKRTTLVTLAGLAGAAKEGAVG
jgi:hypothetical protein